MDLEEMYILLQLTDSVFPTGGFSHSLGLEAFCQHCNNIGKPSGSFAVPFVKAAHYAAKSNQTPVPSDSKIKDDVSVKQTMSYLDKMCQAYSSNHIARRASIRQGKSLMEVSCYIYSDLPPDMITILRDLPYCHQPVVYGFLLAALGLELEITLTSFMFGVVRTLVATAVRLDVLGAMEGQRLQTKLQKLLPNIIARNKNRTVSEACMKFPVIEILQNCQDTLFCKLFYS